MTAASFAGISTENRVIHVVDPLTAGNKDGYGTGYLRSLPLLLRYDVTTFTFPRGWLSAKSTETFDAVVEESGDRQFRYTAIPELMFDYTLIDTDRRVNTLEFDQLCQITSQDLEESQEASTTHKLVDAYKSDKIDELFIITDTADFEIQRAASQKPMAEDIDRISQLDYPALAKKYITETFDKLRLSLGKTRNIWLHHAAAEYEHEMGHEPTQIRDLFEFEILEPGIRTWDVLEFLASDIAKDDPDHIEAVTRPWVESDNSVIETYIRNALQEFDYDREKVRAYREGD
jgi:hypothetical protein